MQTGTMGVNVTHVVPFSKVYSLATCEDKWKGLELQEDLVTTEQYETAKAAWEAGE